MAMAKALIDLTDGAEELSPPIEAGRPDHLLLRITGRADDARGPAAHTCCRRPLKPREVVYTRTPTVPTSLARPTNRANAASGVDSGLTGT